MHIKCESYKIKCILDADYMQIICKLNSYSCSPLLAILARFPYSRLYRIRIFSVLQNLSSDWYDYMETLPGRSWTILIKPPCNFLFVIWTGISLENTVQKREMTSSISSAVRISKIYHLGPGCSFVWILRVVYFTVKHSCLYNKMHCLTCLTATSMPFYTLKFEFILSVWPSVFSCPVGDIVHALFDLSNSYQHAVIYHQVWIILSVWPSVFSCPVGDIVQCSQLLWRVWQRSGCHDCAGKPLVLIQYLEGVYCTLYIIDVRNS